MIDSASFESELNHSGAKSSPAELTCWREGSSGLKELTSSGLSWPIASSSEEAKIVFTALCRRMSLYGGFNQEASHVMEREALVGYMVKTAERFDQSLQIVSIAVSLLDRVCGNYKFEEKHLKLLAGTCLFVASKLAGANAQALDLKTTQSLLGKGFTYQEILNAELNIVSVLGFQLNPVTPLDFLYAMFNLEGSPRPEHTHQLCLFLVRKAMLSFEISRFTPLAIASAILVIARTETGCPEAWPKSLAQATKLSLDSLRPILGELIALTD